MEKLSHKTKTKAQKQRKSGFAFSRARETFMKYVFMLCATVSILSVALICWFLFSNGLPAIQEIGFFNFTLGTDWSPSNVPPSYGIFPMILGSIYITTGAIIVGVPTGILTAVFLVYVCPKSLYKIIKPAVNLLAGIPSVVYGFFGIIILVPLVRNLFGGTGSSMLTASVLLGIMILPTIIGVSETSIRAVSSDLYDGAVALGASHERAVFSVIVPAAKSGISAAVVLGIGRAIGETMAVIMVAGNQPVVRMPNEFLKGVITLTGNIVIEMGYATDLHRKALIATGVVLFAFILIINLLFSLLRKDDDK